MQYSKDFSELVYSVKDTNDENLKFIGTGNPSAQILIIGQEVALDPASEDFDFHYGLHQENSALWYKSICSNLDFEQVNIWGRNNKNYIREDFFPLFPYKGDQKIHKMPSNGGTSKTWKCYQKLASYVYPGLLSREEIDFHKHVFLSEMSSIPFPKSPAKNILTAESIRIRTSKLFPNKFFEHFPVIIIAAGNYVSDKMYRIDLQKIFNQQFIRQDPSEKYKSEWINIHEKEGRLLLHCRQLSFCSDNLLLRLANQIRAHLGL